MKMLLTFSGSIIVFSLFIAGGVQLSSCSKNTVQHDTTVKTVHDTTIKTVTDTLKLTDTVYNYTFIDGLVAYYNFDGGNLNDSSGHSNNIVFNNATLTTDRFGHPNNAYTFDGASSYMRVANSASLNPSRITLFAIVKPVGFYSGTCHTSQILGKGITDDVLGYYALRISDPTIASSGCSLALDTTKEFFNGAYGDDSPVGSASGAANIGFPYVHANEWYTVAFTYDGTLSKIYVNGALLATYSKTVTFNANTNDVYIGMTPNPLFPYNFHGTIDEIRIYNKAITEDKIHLLNETKTRVVVPVSGMKF